MPRAPDKADRKRQRVLIVLGLSIFSIVAGIVAYGFYDEFVAPPKTVAARVGDTVYTQGDLVNRMRMLQAASAATGAPFDFGGKPFEILMDMAEAEMVRRAAPGYNIHVTEQDIQAGLRDRFYPDVPEGQEVRPGQLEREYRENYQGFLDRSFLTDSDYRQIVEESLFKSLLREKLGEVVPFVDEQVEVHWIRLPSEVSAASTGIPGPRPEEVLARLEEESFAAVADDASTDTRYADNKGYVGWVPEGAFPVLDKHLFGDAEQEPVAHNEVVGPLFTQEGTFVFKVTGGPEVREISEVMREGLKTRALETWLRQEVERGGREGWLKINFDSDLYAWALDEVRDARPPATTAPSGQT